MKTVTWAVAAAPSRRSSWRKRSLRGTKRVPGAPLRRRLFLLAAAGIVPLLIMSGIGLYALAQQQRIQAERIGLELARALATAVDAELRSSMSVVQSLATSPQGARPRPRPRRQHSRGGPHGIRARPGPDALAHRRLQHARAQAGGPGGVDDDHCQCGRATSAHGRVSVSRSAAA